MQNNEINFYYREQNKLKEKLNLFLNEIEDAASLMETTPIIYIAYPFTEENSPLWLKNFVKTLALHLLQAGCIVKCDLIKNGGVEKDSLVSILRSDCLLVLGYEGLSDSKFFENNLEKFMTYNKNEKNHKMPKLLAFSITGDNIAVFPNEWQASLANAMFKADTYISFIIHIMKNLYYGSNDITKLLDFTNNNSINFEKYNTTQANLDKHKNEIFISGYNGRTEQISLREVLDEDVIYVDVHAESDVKSVENLVAKLADDNIAVVLGKSGSGKTSLVDALLKYIYEEQMLIYRGGIYYLNFKTIFDADFKNNDKNKQRFLKLNPEELIADIVGRTLKLRNDNIIVLFERLNSWFESTEASLIIYENISISQFDYLQKLLPKEEKYKKKHSIVITSCDIDTTAWKELLKVYSPSTCSKPLIVEGLRDNLTNSSYDHIKIFFEKLDNYDAKQGLNLKKFAELNIADDTLKEISETLDYWPILLKLFYYTYRVLFEENPATSDKLLALIAPSNYSTLSNPNKNLSPSVILNNLILYLLKKLEKEITDSQNVLPTLLAYVTYGDNQLLTEKTAFEKTNDHIKILKRYGLLQSCADKKLKIHSLVQEKLQYCLRDPQIQSCISAENVLSKFIANIYEKFSTLLQIPGYVRDGDKDINCINFCFTTPLKEFNEIMQHSQSLVNYLNKNSITISKDTNKKFVYIRIYMGLVFYFRGMYSSAKDIIKPIYTKAENKKITQPRNYFESLIENVPLIANSQKRAFKYDEISFTAVEFFSLNILRILINAQIYSYQLKLKKIENNSEKNQKRGTFINIINYGIIKGEKLNIFEQIRLTVGKINPYENEKFLLLGIMLNLFGIALTENQQHRLYLPEEIRKAKENFTNLTKFIHNYKIKIDQQKSFIDQIFKIAYWLKCSHLNNTTKYSNFHMRAYLELIVTDLCWGNSLVIRNEYQEALRKYNDAINKLEQINSTFKTIESVQHRNYFLAIAYCYRGELYRRIGLYTEAEKQIEDAVEILSDFFHSNHRELIRCKIIKLKIKYLSQHILEAEDDIKKLLNNDKNFLEFDKDKLDIGVYYARTLITQGRHKEASRELQKCYQFLASLTPESSCDATEINKILPAVNKIYHSRYAALIVHYQGFNFYKQGKYIQAKICYIEALKIYLEMSKYPDKYTKEETSINKEESENTGENDKRQGIFTKAEIHLINNAKENFRTHKNAKAAQILLELANICYRYNDFEEARKLLTSVKEIQELSYLKVHKLHAQVNKAKIPEKINDIMIQEVYIARHCLARIYIAQGNYEKAEEELKFFPSECYNITSIHYTQIKLEYLKGNLVEARKKIEHAKNEYEKLNNKLVNYQKTIQYIRLLRMEALILINLKEYKNAHNNLNRALDYILEIFPHHHPETLMIYWNLGDVYVALGKYSDAYRAYCNADDLIQKSFNKETYYQHPKKMQLMLRYAWYYLQMGVSSLTEENKYYKIECLLRAKHIYQKYYLKQDSASTDYDLISLDLLLAYLNAILGKYLMDESLHQKSLEHLSNFEENIQQNNNIAWHPSWIYIITQLNVENTVENTIFSKDFRERYYNILTIISGKVEKEDSANKKRIDTYLEKIDLNQEDDEPFIVSVGDSKKFDLLIEKFLVGGEDNLDSNNILVQAIGLLQKNADPQQVIENIFSEHIQEPKANILKCMLLGASYALLGHYHIVDYYVNELSAMLNNSRSQIKHLPVVKQFGDYLAAVRGYFIRTSFENVKNNYYPIAKLKKINADLANKKPEYLFFRMLVNLALYDIGQCSLFYQQGNDTATQALSNIKNIFNSNDMSAISIWSWSIPNLVDKRPPVAISKFLLGKILLQKILPDFKNNNFKYTPKQVDDVVEILEYNYGKSSTHENLLHAYAIKAGYLLYVGNYNEAENFFMKTVKGHLRNHKIRDDQHFALMNLRETEHQILLNYLLAYKFPILQKYSEQLLLRIESARIKKLKSASSNNTKSQADLICEKGMAYEEFCHTLVKAYKLVSDINLLSESKKTQLKKTAESIKRYVENIEFKQKGNNIINIDELKAILSIAKLLYQFKYKDNLFSSSDYEYALDSFQQMSSFFKSYSILQVILADKVNIKEIVELIITISDSYISTSKFHPKLCELIFLWNYILLNNLEFLTAYKFNSQNVMEEQQKILAGFLEKNGLQISFIKQIGDQLNGISFQDIGLKDDDIEKISKLISTTCDLIKQNTSKTDPLTIITLSSSAVPMTKPGYVETKYSKELMEHLRLKSDMKGVKFYVISGPSNFGKTELAHDISNQLKIDNFLIFKLIYPSTSDGTKLKDGEFVKERNNDYLGLLYKLGFKGNRAIEEFYQELSKQEVKTALILDNFPKTTSTQEVELLLYQYIPIKDLSKINLNIIITTQDTALNNKLYQMGLLVLNPYYCNISNGFNLAEAKALISQIVSDNISEAALDKIKISKLSPSYLTEVAKYISVNKGNKTCNEFLETSDWRGFFNDFIRNNNYMKIAWAKSIPQEKKIYKLIALVNHYDIPFKIIKQSFDNEVVDYDVLRACSLIDMDTNINVILALSNYTPEEADELQKLAGKACQKLKFLNLEDENCYKKVAFTQEEISHIEVALAKTNNEISTNLSMKLNSSSTLEFHETISNTLFKLLEAELEDAAQKHVSTQQNKKNWVYKQKIYEKEIFNEYKKQLSYADALINDKRQIENEFNASNFRKERLEEFATKYWEELKAPYKYRSLEPYLKIINDAFRKNELHVPADDIRDRFRLQFEVLIEKLETLGINLLEKPEIGRLYGNIGVIYWMRYHFSGGLLEDKEKGIKYLKLACDICLKIDGLKPHISYVQRANWINLEKPNQQLDNLRAIRKEFESYSSLDPFLAEALIINNVNILRCIKSDVVELSAEVEIAEKAIKNSNLNPNKKFMELAFIYTCKAHGYWEHQKNTVYELYEIYKFAKEATSKFKESGSLPEIEKLSSDYIYYLRAAIIENLSLLELIQRESEIAVNEIKALVDRKKEFKHTIAATYSNLYTKMLGLRSAKEDDELKNYRIHYTSLAEKPNLIKETPNEDSFDGSLVQGSADNKFEDAQQSLIATRAPSSEAAQYFNAMKLALQKLNSLALPEAFGGTNEIILYLKSGLEQDNVTINAFEWDMHPATSETGGIQLESHNFPYANFKDDFLSHPEQQTFILPLLLMQAHFAGLVIIKQAEKWQVKYINPTGSNPPQKGEDKEALANITRALQKLTVDHQIKFEEIEILSNKQQQNESDCAFIVAQTLIDVANNQELSIKPYAGDMDAYVKPLAQARAHFYSQERLGDSYERVIRDQLYSRLAKALTINQRYAEPLEIFLRRKDIDQYRLHASIVKELNVLLTQIESGTIANQLGTLLMDKATSFLTTSVILKNIELADIKEFCDTLLEPHFTKEGSLIFKLNDNLQPYNKSNSNRSTLFQPKSNNTSLASSSTSPVSPPGNIHFKP